MNTDYLNLLKQRRTIYALGKNVPLTDDEISELVISIIRESPTAFNAQSTRAVVLFNEYHERLWDLTIDRLKSEVPDAAAFENTKNKINSFKAGHGTILFFKDQSVIEEMQKNFTLYADNFPDWSEQTQGNIQLGIWTALANNNIGASIQHYNPLIDAQVAEAFDIPKNWVLRAEMPFGSVDAPAGDKDYMADTDRFKIFK